MPVIELGEHLRSVYLDRWDPAPGQDYVISLLSLKAVATQSHWVDRPEANIRGKFECAETHCCNAFGNPFQNYNFPIWVYQNPKDSTEGDFYYWSLSRFLYDRLIKMAEQGDLLKNDLIVSPRLQGQGVQTDISFRPGGFTLRDYMEADLVSRVESSVQHFFNVAESEIHQQIGDKGWVEMLQALNYDFSSGSPLPPSSALPQNFGGGYAQPQQTQKQFGVVKNPSTQGKIPAPQTGVKQNSALPQPPQAQETRSSRIPQAPTETPTETPQNSIPQPPTETPQNSIPQPPTGEVQTQVNEVTEEELMSMLQ